MAVGAAPALADSPAAGTRILNQAVIDYVDAAGVAQSTTTNEVALVVQRVYAASLTANRSITLAAGGAATFHHTLRNDGNGSDLYCLSLANDSNPAHAAAFSNAQVVLDRDGDGAVSPADAVLTTVGGAAGLIQLDRGESAALLVAADAPGGLIDGDTLGLALTAQAQQDTGACVAASVGDNTDTATITGDAVLEARKTSTYLPGGAGVADDAIRYTVTVENTGSRDAETVVVRDVLPTGTTFSAFVTSSGFDVGPSHAAGEVSGQITTLAPGASASMTFDATLDDLDGGGAAVPSGTEYVNTATAQGNLDGVAGDEPAVTSNETVDELAYARAVDIADTGAGGDSALNDGGDDDNTLNNTQTALNIPEGAPAAFRLTVANTGSARDLMELLIRDMTALTLSLDAQNFPAGTAFRLTRADGTTPLLDGDGDGWAELGPLDPGESVTVYAYADLPFNAAGAPYEAEVAIRADQDETVTDASKLRLQTSAAAALDLAGTANPAFADDGTVNADPAASVTAAAATIAAGAQGSLSLLIANEAGATETYALSVGSDIGLTTGLPSGWTASFTEGGASGLSTVGPVASGATNAFSMQVAVPAGTAPGVYDLYVRAASSLSGAVDVVHVTVTVSEARGIVLAPDQSAIIAPCASHGYRHRLANLGDSFETVSLRINGQTLLTSALAYPTAAAGGEAGAFVPAADLTVGSTVVVYDASAGAFAAVALTAGVGGAAFSVPLEIGDFIDVQATVFADCATPEGVQDILGLVAQAASGVTASVQDVSMISNTQLVLQKAGAPSPGCALGPTDPGLIFQTGGVGAQPGDCVVWRVTATNFGAAPLCQVRLRDQAPAFTQLQPGAVVANEPAPGAGACVESDPDVVCTVGNAIDIDGDGALESFCLLGGETAQMRFSVLIQ